jgi:hypothetical protein
MFLLTYAKLITVFLGLFSIYFTYYLFSCVIFWLIDSTSEAWGLFVAENDALDSCILVDWFTGCFSEVLHVIV